MAVITTTASTATRAMAARYNGRNNYGGHDGYDSPDGYNSHDG